MILDIYVVQKVVEYVINSGRVIVTQVSVSKKKHIRILSKIKNWAWFL